MAINHKQFQLSTNQKDVLDQRKKKHLEGKSKSYSWNEVKQRARISKQNS
ncbi:MAG: hypothetical protein ACI9J3_003817 [Parvicellaceae bacterium]|jgi:hypothetical protein